MVIVLVIWYCACIPYGSIHNVQIYQYVNNNFDIFIATPWLLCDIGITDFCWKNDNVEVYIKYWLNTHFLVMVWHSWWKMGLVHLAILEHPIDISQYGILDIKISYVTSMFWDYFVLTNFFGDGFEMSVRL